MLNKTIRKTIIVTIQSFVPVLLLLIITPLLLNHSHQLNKAGVFLNNYQNQFLLAHVAFYLVLFYSWPWLIKITVNRLNSCPNECQIKTAITARYYLIAVLVFFELLKCWQ